MRGDLDALVELWRHLDEVQRHLRIYPPATDQEAVVRSEMTGLIDDADSCTFVVESVAEVVAMATAEVGRKGGLNDTVVCRLSRVVVHPDHRARGVASMLIGHAERFARARGAAFLSAWVYSGNADGKSYWLQRGFAPRAEELVRPILGEGSEEDP